MIATGPLRLPEPDQQRARLPRLFRGALDVRAADDQRRDEARRRRALAALVAADELTPTTSCRASSTAGRAGCRAGVADGGRAQRRAAPARRRRRRVSDPADLGVAEASASLARRESVRGRTSRQACLARIAERDGVHSHDGDPGSVNAWVRVYEEDARVAAAARGRAAGGRRRAALCGVPIGLKDLYAVAGKPVTASSRLLDDVPKRDCDAWARLAAAGMVLLGHLHTHEFAAGGTTDQVGNPWACAARRAARAAARRPRSPLVRPLPRRAPTPQARCASPPHVRHLDDQADARSRLDPRHRPARAELRSRRPDGADGRRLRAAAGGAGRRRASVRAPAAAQIALSPRIGELDPDVAEGLERALALLPLVEVAPPEIELDVSAGPSTRS